MKQDGDREGSEEKRNGLCLVRDAVVDSWPLIAADEREQFGFQMYGRLQEAEEWPVRKYLESVRKWQKGLWLKPYGECWARPGKGSSAEFVLRGEVPIAVAVYGEPSCAVVSTREGRLFLLNLGEKRVIKTLDMDDWVMAVAISSDERQIVSCCGPDGVKRWDLENGVEIECAEYCDALVSEGEYKVDSCMNCAAFSADCRVIVSGSDCGYVHVHVWDVTRGKMVGEAIRGFGGDVWCVAVSLEGSRFVAGGVCGWLRMWHNSGGTKHLWDAHHTDGVFCAAFSPDGRFVVSGGGDGTIRLLKAINGEQIGNPLTGHKDCVRCLTFTPDGKKIVSGGDDGTVRLWNVETGTQVGGPLRRRYDELNGICVSNNGRFVVSVSNEGLVHVSDLQDVTNGTDNCITDDSWVFCLAARLDEHHFVSVHRYDNTTFGGCSMRIWDAESRKQIGQPLHVRESKRSFVCCVALSPNSRYLICGMSDGTMQLWDVASRAQVGGEICAHTYKVNSVGLSPDGQYIVSGSDDCTARMWSVETQAEVGVFRGGARRVKRRRASFLQVAGGLRLSTEMEMILEHDDSVGFVSFSMDGSRIVSVTTWSCKICAWETSSGKLVGRANAIRHTICKTDMKNDCVTRLHFSMRNIKRERWGLDRDGSLIEN